METHPHARARVGWGGEGVWIGGRRGRGVGPLGLLQRGHHVAAWPNDIARLCPKFNSDRISGIISFVPHYTAKSTLQSMAAAGARLVASASWRAAAARERRRVSDIARSRSGSGEARSRSARSDIARCS